MVLQDLHSSDAPTQSKPPFNDAGHLHSRVRLEVPSPQDFEHKLQGDQEHQLPFSTNKKYYMVLIRKQKKNRNSFILNDFSTR